MENKWTEGPWGVHEGNLGFPNIGSASGEIVGDEGCYRGDGSDWANAYLIAASPDLYLALELALEDAEREGAPYKPWHDLARAALAKANLPIEHSREVEETPCAECEA